MKRTVLTILTSIVATSVLWLLLGAAPPAPIWRNNFTTNEPPFPVIGDWSYSNSLAGIPPNASTNMFIVDRTGIFQVPPNGTWSPLWELFGCCDQSGRILEWGPFQNSALNTNGSAVLSVDNGSVTTLDVYYGSTGPQAAQAFQIHDAAGNVVGYFRTNVFWATTNDFFSTFQSTDNTTNVMFSLTPRDNSVVRVEVKVTAWNSTSSASYGRAGCFKSVAGTVTQVGAIAGLGIFEDDAAFECLLDTAANLIRVRVAGNTGKTVNWKCYVNTIYGE